MERLVLQPPAPRCESLEAPHRVLPSLISSPLSVGLEWNALMPDRQASPAAVVYPRLPPMTSVYRSCIANAIQRLEERSRWITSQPLRVTGHTQIPEQ